MVNADKKQAAAKAAAGAEPKKREAEREKNPPASARTVYSRFSPSTREKSQPKVIMFA